MKRSRVSPTSDDQVPSIDQLQQNNLSALDVNNFAVNWPIWRQQFQIYLSATTQDPDHLTDQKKLSIFLNCLGKDGIALATSFFPQLKDFDSAEAKEVTMDMVWSRFNDHSTLAGKGTSQDVYLASHKFLNTYIDEFEDQSIDDFYPELLSAAEKCDFKCRVCQTSYTERIVRDQLVEAVCDSYTVSEFLDLKDPSSQEVIAKYKEINRDQEIWRGILDFLCPCDIEAVGQTSFRMQQIVNKHVDTRSYKLQIDPCCLQKHPIRTDSEFYEKFKSTYMYLGLNRIPATEVDQVLKFFPNINHLGLYNMQILDELSAFPGKLSHLTITNSVFESELMQHWLSYNQWTLRSLTMENVEHSFPLNGKLGVLGKELTIDYCSNLHWLTIRCESLNLKVGPNEKNLWSMDIQATRLINFDIDCRSNLQELIWNVPALPSRFPDSLTELTLAEWNNSSGDRIKLPKLKCLTILAPVDFMYKEQIEKLNIKTVLVTYGKSPEEEPELIFEMLNDDCFLEIISYLTNPEWIKFGQLHPRSAWIVINYKYPRANLTGSDFDNSTITPQNFDEICPYVRSMTIDCGWTSNFLCEFTELRSLSLETICITKENIGTLPVGLEKLRLRDSYFVCGRNLNLTEYFKKLSSTLRVLEVDNFGHYDVQCFLELRGLREIKCLKGISPDKIVMFLKQNPDLKRVGVVDITKDICNVLGTLKNLSDLSVLSLEENMPYSSMLGMLEQIGSQLRTLSFTRLGAETSSLLRCAKLQNLQELKIGVRPKLRVNFIIDNICSLKGLRTLRIKKVVVTRSRCAWNYDYYYDDYDDDDYDECDEEEFVTVSNVMRLLKELPNLRQIHSDFLEPFSMKMGVELRQYLRENNRNIRINSVDL